MKISRILFYLIIAFLAFQSCQQEAVVPELTSGLYSGIFQISDLKTGQVSSGLVELNLSEERFACSENPNRLPAGGSGSFRQKDEHITFEDEHIWPHNFDMQLVLTGRYDYSFDGTQLHLWKEVGAARYEYLLERE